jgi:hypothetical protein
MKLDKKFLARVVDFEYFEDYSTGMDGVTFIKHEDSYGIELSYNSNGEFECKTWVEDNEIELDDETLDWLFTCAEKSLEDYKEQLYDEERKRSISYDYFMSSNFEKY